MITPISLIERKLHEKIEKMETAVRDELGHYYYIQVTAQVVALDELLQEMIRYYREDEESEESSDEESEDDFIW